MIGNDIVDMCKATFSCAARRDRYALKILSSKELIEYTSASNKTTLLWRYWSIKEAVFKAYTQQYQDYRFSPCKIQVLLKDSVLSEARINDIIFNCSTQSVGDAIYSTAVQNNKQKIVSRLVQNIHKSNASNQVRSLLLKEVSSLKKIRSEALLIRKNDRKIPRLYNKESKESWPISLTHHGNYVGYAIVL